MERALDACPIVGGELSDALDNVIQLLPGNLLVAQSHLVSDKASFGEAAQVEDHLQQFVAAIGLSHCLFEMRRQDGQQGIQIVSNTLLHIVYVVP